MLFHNLRRISVWNMVWAGVPEWVAIQISEDKTRSVFETYNIVSEGDLQEAARKIAAYRDRDSNGSPQHNSQHESVTGGPARTSAHHEHIMDRPDDPFQHMAGLIAAWLAGARLSYCRIGVSTAPPLSASHAFRRT
jgi:hypothetical protein